MKLTCYLCAANLVILGIIVSLLAEDSRLSAKQIACALQVDAETVIQTVRSLEVQLLIRYLRRA